MKYTNVLSLLEEITVKNSERTALGIKTSLGWSEFTYKGLGLLSRQLAHYLIYDLKLEKRDKLAILSESKPEYGACVFGAVLAGLTTVPLDNKLTIYELTSILENCMPQVLLVSASNYGRAMELKKSIPSIKEVILMDEQKNAKSLYSIPKNYDAKWVRRPLSDTAFIIYTSGTTGKPKGVQITFKNMLSQMNDLKLVLKEILPPNKDMRLLSILPMNHLFELTVGFFTFLNHGHSIYYAKSLKPKDIIDALSEKKIRFMITVPAFLKLLKTSIESDISKRSKLQQFGFKFSYLIAKSLPIRLRKLLFKSINKKFGGEFYGCISGGAPLDIKTGSFFERIGIKIYQGYGLSEASPVVTMNRGKYQNLNSVGQLLNSFEARLDKNTGELLVKGPSVMKGYYKNEELTKEVIEEDGWLHTGDVAEIDSHGLVYITGRIKNMIVLSGGKKVFPEEVEAVFSKSPHFAEVCVMGIPKSFGEKGGTEEVVAVVVPNFDYSKTFADVKSLEISVTNEVKKLSERLAPYKRPIRIVIRHENLPRTATNKIKRNEVKKILCNV